MNMLTAIRRLPPARRRTGRRSCVVGLINNMPDAALGATRRQFARLVAPAAADDIVLRCYVFPETPRGPTARQTIAQSYEPVSSLRDDPPDALIITGAAPQAPLLPQEPYWRSLTEVLDWAWNNGIPVVLSCLAAHAAVLHADGVQRQRLPRKCSGVFAQEMRPGQALLRGLRPGLRMPHSRWNALPQGALIATGYQILTCSAEAGADMFIHPRYPQTLFLNGHPEYEAETLLKEYCRDIAAFLQGESAHYPDLPSSYLDPETAALFEAFRLRAISDPEPALLSALPSPLRPPSAPWQSAAVTLFRNWLIHARQRAA